MSDLTNLFRARDLSTYPDVHSYADDLDALLWILVVGHEELGVDGISSGDVTQVLRDVFRRDVSRQRASALLLAARKMVAKRKSNGRTLFSPMRPAIDHIKASGQQVIIVDPQNAFTALQKLEKVLAGVKGHLRVCDPYVDSKTLVQLTAVPKEVPISLLTLNIQDSSRLRRDLPAYEREFGNLELRIDAQGDLHDRYLIDEEIMWSLGQSLNGIGKKQSMIVAMGKDIRTEMLSAYNKRWSRASVWR